MMCHHTYDKEYTTASVAKGHVITWEMGRDTCQKLSRVYSNLSYVSTVYMLPSSYRSHRPTTPKLFFDNISPFSVMLHAILGSNINAWIFITIIPMNSLWYILHLFLLFHALGFIFHCTHRKGKSIISYMGSELGDI